jgi:hypothetical protein
MFKKEDICKKKKKTCWPGMVAHSFNPSCMGGVGKRIKVQGLLRTEIQDPI